MGQTSRRGFLGLLAAGAAGLVLDPERLLWRPGAKTIFLPPASRIAVISPDIARLLTASMADYFNPPQGVIDSFHAMRFSTEWRVRA